MKLLPSKSMVRGYPVLLPLHGTCDKNAIVDSCVFLVASTFCPWPVVFGHGCPKLLFVWVQGYWRCILFFVIDFNNSIKRSNQDVIDFHADAFQFRLRRRCLRNSIIIRALCFFGLLLKIAVAVIFFWCLTELLFCKIETRERRLLYSFGLVQFLLNFFFWFLFFRIICCENHIALMYELAIFDLDFLNFSWRKSTGRKLFRFCLTVERKRCRYADLCHIMLWRGVFHVIFFGICFLNKSPYCSNRDYDCCANQNLPFFVIQQSPLKKRFVIWLTTYVTNYTTIQSGSPLFFYLTNNFIMIVLFMSSRKEAGKKLRLKSKKRMIAFHDGNNQK